MIKIIDNSFSQYDEFKEFCKLDSFGTRIYSHFLCYGIGINFIDFWVQLDNNEEITCVFCKFENDFVVSICDNADFDEIKSFLLFQEKQSVTIDSKYRDCFSDAFSGFLYGDILLYNGNDNRVSHFDIVTPQIKDYHNLLLSCESDDFFVPEYMNFLSDTTLRIRKDMCYIYGITFDSNLASCAMTVSYTDFSVILGAVATHPDYRGKGFAGFIVTELADEFANSGNVYIYTTIKKNTHFYEKLGFSVSGEWTKFICGG